MTVGKPKTPGNWADHAACRGHNHVMALPCGSNRQSARRILHLAQPAIAICNTCPVLQECRSWALTTPDPAIDHVAGGLTPHQRHQHRKQQR